MEVRRLSEKSEWSSLAGVFVQRCNPFSLCLYCVSMVHSGIHGASGALELLMDPCLSPGIIPCECEVTSVQWGTDFNSSGGNWSRNSILLRAPAMMLAVPGVRGGWGPSSALNFRWAQPCCSWKGSCSTEEQDCSYQPFLPLLCLLGLEGRVSLSLWYHVKMLFSCYVFPWSFLSHNHQLARCVCTRRFFLSN